MNPGVPEPTDKRTLGVLGGMGPQATVDFLNEIVARTPATGDADHLRILLDNNPGVPDRQAALAGDRLAVEHALRDMALGLEALGADFLVMPCNTAHAFVDAAVAATSVPFVSIIDSTVAAVRRVAPAARRVGLLATTACIEAGVYQQAAREADLEIVVPDGSSQLDCMRLIAAVKGGDTSDDVHREMHTLAEELVSKGVDALIAGCTEIPLVLEGDVRGVPLLSSTDELAQAAVDLALGRIPLPPAKT